MKLKSMITMLLLMLGGTLVVSVLAMASGATGNAATNSPVATDDLLTDLLSSDELAESGQTEFTLGVGGRKFWPREPENVNQASKLDPSLCNKEGEPGPCRYYKLKLVPDGARLRVALRIVYQDWRDVQDWPDFNFGGDRNMVFRMQLFDPSTADNPNREVFQTCEGLPTQDFVTKKVEPTTTDCDVSTNDQFQNAGYAAELTLKNPVPGIWTVRVIPTKVEKFAFMMRAKLEAPPDPSAAVALLPNLRVMPPYEFTFKTPASAAAVFGPDSGITGPYPGCMAEEIREAAEEALRHEQDPVQAIPKLCLRYSMGIENTGDGPFWIVGWLKTFRELESGTIDSETTSEELEMTQRIRYSDNTWAWEDYGSAGDAHLDPSHLHIHYDGFWKFTLFRVNPVGWTLASRKEPELEDLGDGCKIGGQPTDEYMSDWSRFYQGLQGEERSMYFARHDECSQLDPNCINPFQDAWLQTGWGDAYEWNRSGNYVSFPMDPSGIPQQGLYLVRGEADPGHLIRETNESDNFGYALIEILADGSVKFWERGYGLGPWDPMKQVLTESP